jgi:hypothetical protein
MNKSDDYRDPSTFILPSVSFLPDDSSKPSRPHASPATDDHGSSGRRSEESDLATLAQQILSSRHKRATMFGGELFKDPAYDILLEVFSRTQTGELTSPSIACAATSVPHATAVRHISLLVQKSYIERIVNPWDKRSINLKLTPLAMDKMTRWLGRFLQALSDQNGHAA